MRKKKLWLIPLALLAGAVAWEGLTAHPTGAGDAAPAFSATALDGRTVQLAAYRGKAPVLLNFYADT